MDEPLSRTEKKRRAKDIGMLAAELVALSSGEIHRLPCETALKEELLAAKSLKGPAGKRQIKFISKELRKTDPNALFAILEEKKGSRLKAKKEFHELEHLRDTIITAAIRLHEDFLDQEITPQVSDFTDEFTNSVQQKFPDLDIYSVKKSALRYAATRVMKYSREVFRLLTAASEQQKFARKQR